MNIGLTNPQQFETGQTGWCGEGSVQIVHAESIRIDTLEKQIKLKKLIKNQSTICYKQDPITTIYLKGNTGKETSVYNLLKSQCEGKIMNNVKREFYRHFQRFKTPKLVVLVPFHWIKYYSNKSCWLETLEFTLNILNFFKNEIVGTVWSK